MAEGFTAFILQSHTPSRASPDVGGRFISAERTCTVPHANSASVTGETFNTKEKVHLSYKPKWHALIFSSVIGMIFVVLSSEKHVKGIL